MVKEMTGPLFSLLAGPTIFTPGIADSFSKAYLVNSRPCAVMLSMPVSCRYSTAAINPAAPAKLGVPASNFQGRSFQVDFSKVTSRIMSPPYKNGCIFSSNSFLPYTTPIPAGAHILWPEKTMKSQLNSFTSTGRCGTDCAASTIISAPLMCHFCQFFYCIDGSQHI